MTREERASSRKCHSTFSRRGSAKILADRKSRKYMILQVKLASGPIGSWAADSPREYAPSSPAPLLALGRAAARVRLEAVREAEARAVLERRLGDLERRATVGMIARAVVHELSTPIQVLLFQSAEIHQRVTALTPLV